MAPTGTFNRVGVESVQTLMAFVQPNTPEQAVDARECLHQVQYARYRWLIFTSSLILEHSTL